MTIIVFYFQEAQWNESELDRKNQELQSKVTKTLTMYTYIIMAYTTSTCVPYFMYMYTHIMHILYIQLAEVTYEAGAVRNQLEQLKVGHLSVIL